jgi:hypothetical protein
MDGWLGGFLAAAPRLFFCVESTTSRGNHQQIQPFTLTLFYRSGYPLFSGIPDHQSPAPHDCRDIPDALVFALPLAIRLSTGLSNATVRGGFIPYKDGLLLLQWREHLLNGQPITANGLQARSGRYSRDYFQSF